MSDFWKQLNTLLFGSKGLGTLGFATFLGSAVSAIFFVYVAPLLGAENFGKLIFLYAVASLTFAISYFAGGTTLMVYLPKGIKIMSTVSFITLISCSAASVILYIILQDFAVSLLIIGLAISNLATSELIAKKNYFVLTKFVIVQRILFVVLALFLYYLFDVSGLIVGIALSFIPYIVRLYDGFKESKVDFSLIKSRLGFIMNSYGIWVTAASYGHIDRLIILPLFGYEFLGNYGLAIQIIVFMYLFPVVINQYVLPRDAVEAPTQKLKIISILFSVVLTLHAIFLAPKILPIFFPEFVKSIELIPIMALAVIPHTILRMYSSKFLGAEKSKFVIVGSILHLLALILGIVILGNIYGILGVASAFVISEVIEAIYLFSIFRITFKKFI